MEDAHLRLELNENELKTVVFRQAFKQAVILQCKMDC